MDSKKSICALFFYIGISAAGYSDNNKDSLGLPGDNLDLSGVLELFKKSATPEEFETALNKEENKVNNLDLNGDGEIDYIKVIDRTDNGAHALILQAPVNDTEAQDVAVIEIEKKDNETAHVQIVGDEDLYGKDYIVEPSVNETVDAPAPPEALATNPPPVVVNIVAWPVVRHIYTPTYTVWVSPWRWRHYPGWWKPWKPYHRHVYYTRIHPHRGYHHRVYSYHSPRAHKVYHSHRVVSKTVYQRRNAVGAPNRVGRQGRRVENQPRQQQGPRQAAPRQNRAKQQHAAPRQHKGPRK